MKKNQHTVNSSISHCPAGELKCNKFRNYLNSWYSIQRFPFILYYLLQGASPNMTVDRRIKIVFDLEIVGGIHSTEFHLLNAIKIV